MKKILLLNPAISTLNKGDEIICESAISQIDYLLNDAFVVNVSTHLPVSEVYASLLKSSGFDHTFVLGTNLLMGKLTGKFKQWDINRETSQLLPKCVLIGAGWWQYNNEANYRTKKIYHKILDSEYMHSVRDEYTAEQLKKIGITNTLVTACPTMWNFTKEFTAEIPTKLASNVCTTVTDYSKDPIADAKMLSTLTKKYACVYLWMQGIRDFDYYSEIKETVSDNQKIKLVAPTVEAYDKVLNMPDMEYVGTRLHAGIRAIQHKKRALIIGVDNRAKEKHISFNLNVLERAQIDNLSSVLDSEIKTDINIPTAVIAQWKQQFIK